MPLEQDTIDNVKDKKFTDFSNAVKQELKQKLSSHKGTKEYVSDFDKIKQMKDSFAKISKINQENNEPEPVIELGRDPVEPDLPKSDEE